MSVLNRFRDRYDHGLRALAPQIVDHHIRSAPAFEKRYVPTATAPAWSLGRVSPTRYMKTVERIAAKLIETGFTLRQAAVLLSRIYNSTTQLRDGRTSRIPAPGRPTLSAI
ncbi:MAG TPA: hypothetical protein VMP12_11030 [Candidatus Sulfotelmatobacter sp.]|nr:hypothetical protein [Candidatus Sulfotelmatobacter sp.]